MLLWVFYEIENKSIGMDFEGRNSTNIDSDYHDGNKSSQRFQCLVHYI